MAIADSSHASKAADISNPHRVQVYVDYPDLTDKAVAAKQIAIPGPRRKFLASADGDNSFYELKDIITKQLHLLYPSEAPYGLCSIKNWQHSIIPERYLLRDVLIENCDIHVTRELLSAKKLGKAVKRKAEEEPSSSTSVTANFASPPAANLPNLASKPKKIKNKATDTPGNEAKPKPNVATNKEVSAATKETAIADKETTSTAGAATSENADVVKTDPSAYANLSEMEIMKKISAEAQARKNKSISEVAVPDSGASTDATPKKQKNTKKTEAVVTPAPVLPATPTKSAGSTASAVPVTVTPTPAKASAKSKKAAVSTASSADKEKSEDEIMKDISAKFQAQKKSAEANKAVPATESAEAPKKTTPVAAANEKAVGKSKTGRTETKEQTKPKKEQAKSKKEQSSIANDTDASTNEAQTASADVKVTKPKSKKDAEPVPESSIVPATPKAKKAEKVSESSSDSTEVAKVPGKRSNRRKPEEEDLLEKLAAQDPLTLTEEQRRQVRLHERRKYSRERNEAIRKAKIDVLSDDPKIAAAAQLILAPRPRGRPQPTEESPRKLIHQFIQEKSTEDSEDDGSPSSPSSSQSPETEIVVKAEQPIKSESRVASRAILPPSFGTDSESESGSE
ncbi:hypothetical protein FBU30_005965 [Linnemannia zychae]|nr:hypothetical protein FBU30_005965 [Linnemannia zychae]